MGLPVPEHMQGHSLLLLLNGQRDHWPAEMFIQISESQIGRSTHRTLEIQRQRAWSRRQQRTRFRPLRRGVLSTICTPIRTN